MLVWPLTCFNTITRRAYNPIDPAVNTSRPRIVMFPSEKVGKVTKKLVYPLKSHYFSVIKPLYEPKVCRYQREKITPRSAGGAHTKSL